MTNAFQHNLKTSIIKKNPAIREEVVKRLKALSRDQPASYEALVGIMEQDSAPTSVRSAACWLLGQGNYKRAAAGLLRVFSQEQSSLLWESAKALGSLRAKMVVRPLISLLESNSTEHRAAAAYTLGIMREHSAIKPLHKVLANRKESARVRGHAAEALAYIRDRRSFSALLSALSDRSPEVRWWAAFALGEMGDKRALQALNQLAAKDSGRLQSGRSVRVEARRACQRLDQRAIKASAK